MFPSASPHLSLLFLTFYTSHQLCQLGQVRPAGPLAILKRGEFLDLLLHVQLMYSSWALYRPLVGLNLRVIRWYFSRNVASHIRDCCGTICPQACTKELPHSCSALWAQHIFFRSLLGPQNFHSIVHHRDFLVQLAWDGDTVRYHCGGWSEELNSRSLLLAYMVYL